MKSRILSQYAIRFVLPFVFFCAPNAAPAQTLIGLYEFDGNGDDSSGNNNDLTPASGVTYSTAGMGTGSSWFTEASPIAMFAGGGSGSTTTWFDGSEPYHGSTSFYEQAQQGGVTLSFWFYTTVNTGSQYLFSESRLVNPPNTLYGLYLSSNKINLIVRNNNNTTISNPSSDTAISTNTWYHVTFVHNQGSVSLYINGVLDEGITGYDPDTAGVLEVGSTSIGSLYRNNPATSNFGFSGGIGSFQVYKGALTSAQVANLYQTGVIPEPETTTLVLGAGLLGLMLWIRQRHSLAVISPRR